MDELMRLVLAAAGTLGFGLIFNINKRYLPAAAAGGFIAWFSYVVSRELIESMFMQALISGFIIAVYAEILARLYKAPSTIFFVVSVIPLVPGKPLYECMNALAENNWILAKSKGLETLIFAVGIAGGMGIAWCLCDLQRKLKAAAK